MKPKKSRLLHSSRTKSSKEVNKMTKSLAYIGVVAVVVGVLLTTCVGSAWSMELLMDEQLAVVQGRSCAVWDCVPESCGTANPCNLHGGSPTDACYKWNPDFDCSEKVRLQYKQCQTTGSDPECSNEDKEYDCIQWYCGFFGAGCSCGYTGPIDPAHGCDS